MARIDQLIHRRSTETLGQRIRRRRKALRLTQAELCAAAAINQGFLSEIERDRANPSRRTLDPLSVALDIPQAVLIGAGDEHDTPQPLEVKEVPLLGAIPAGQPSQSQEQLEMFPVLRHLWSADRYCLRLTFDSMEPTLKPDDIVLVRYQPNVDPTHVQGRICATDEGIGSGQGYWLAGATVSTTVGPDIFTTTTDVDGFFRLDGVPVGNHTLVVVKGSFSSSTSVGSRPRPR